MASTQGILVRRSQRKIQRRFDLQLTSMMDILIIIVIFLLKSYNTSMNNFSPPAGIKLPTSLSQEVPNDSVAVIVTSDSLTVGNERVVDFAPSTENTENKTASESFKESDLDEGGRRIVPLYDALVKEREKTELLLAKSQSRLDGKPLPFEGILAIQADKRVKYKTLRKIMYTGAAAGYQVFRFLAMKRDS
jgi:biopolymer transport protein ExbD